MKFCITFVASIAALFGQAPTTSLIVAPETVVAKVDGKDITAGEIRHFLETLPPQGLATVRADPNALLISMALTEHFASEGEKKKLYEESPWKEQLEASRAQILSAAAATYERNNYRVSEEQVEAYYAKNLANYQQAHIRLIKIGFTPSIPNDPKDLQKAAQAAVQAAHAESARSEAAAQKLADEIVKKARAGEDFEKLVSQYSEDQESKAAGGDYGNVTKSSSLPEAIKNSILSLEVGKVTDPVRISTSYFVVKVDSKSAQPLNAAHEEIMQAIKSEHLQTVMGDLRTQFRPSILRPEFFIQINSTRQ
jgi:peptidyl-prolyl cis-trans isomerase C